MTQGLQVFNASGVLTFDSNLAVGGVCLGFYTVAAGGSVWSFPDFAGCTGLFLMAGAGFGPYVGTVDTSLGYPRFTFPAITEGMTMVLFAK